MADQETPASLRRGWTSLRRDLLFLPRLEGLTVTAEKVALEAVEFVRIAPSDQVVVTAEAPHVTTDDVRDYPDWSDAEEDQQAMWALAGRQIEGSRTTETCPDCGGGKRLTCDHCGGAGRVTCTSCSGSGQTSCSSCGGSGGRHVSRTETDAQGNSTTTMEWESCSSCGGSGQDRCSWCWGSGSVTCSTCSGSGEVTCTTCSPRGTVDRYIRRTFVASTVATRLLPVSLPGYPHPVGLSKGHVTVQARCTVTPYDAVADRSLLAERQVEHPPARLFFIRPAVVELHSVTDPRTGALAATFIDGEPEPILTLHNTVQDPQWSPDQERSRAMLAFLLYAASILVLGGAIAAGPLFPAVPPAWLIGGGAGAALLAAGGGWLLYRGPVRAFRTAFLDLRCARHGARAPLRCPHCAQDLCAECAAPVARCPQCGGIIARAATHVVEDGRWVEASGARAAAAGEVEEG